MFLLSTTLNRDIDILPHESHTYYNHWIYTTVRYFRLRGMIDIQMWLTSIRWGDNHSVMLVEEHQTVVIPGTAWYQSQFGAQQSTLIEFRVYLASHM